MLSVETPFPFSGSKAFLAPDAAPVKIQRVNLDHTALITRLPCSCTPGREVRQMAIVASGNTTVPLDQLHPTPAEALGLPAPGEAIPAKPRAKRARRSAR